jgi:LysM repeat protein
MRYKDYVWPHNPRTYQIEYKRRVVSHKVPYGLYVLEGMGRDNRVFKGEGEFVGTGAYDEFKKLASVFYGTKPGLLVHPLWQEAQCYFVQLTLLQEPKEDYVSYSFEFWECYDGYETGLTQVKTTTTETKSESKSYYTVVSGDCLYNIALKYSLTLAQLIALNPQIKNTNIIYPGDKIRVA